MKYAFVCDTPYQILSTIAFVFDKNNRVAYADLYVEVLRCRNVDMQKLVERVKQSKLFANVYVLESLPIKYSSYRKLLKAYEWLFPKKSFIHTLKEKVNLQKKEYDVIGITGPFILQRNFLRFFPKASIFFLEDGSGSYNGRIGINLLSWRGKVVQKILKRGPQYIYPKRCFLFCPEFYSGEYRKILGKLHFPMDQIDLLRKIYDVHDNFQYRNARFILLGQTMFNHEKKQETDRKILSLLAAHCGEDLLIRPHPAEDMDKYSEMEIDRSVNQWELVCAEIINDEKVLIGKYSTAQLIPKLIFDQEPYLVFLYKLFGYTDERIEKGIKHIKKLYRDKTKIINIGTLGELEEIIDLLKE